MSNESIFFQLFIALYLQDVCMIVAVHMESVLPFHVWEGSGLRTRLPGLYVKNFCLLSHLSGPTETLIMRYSCVILLMYIYFFIFFKYIS